MSDYRGAFFDNYLQAVSNCERIDKDYYSRCARQFRGRWVHWLPEDRSAPMLDLGCGRGEYLYFLRSLGYENVFGVDLCESGLECARRMGIPNLIRANALDYLKEKTDCFEVISAFNIFEHLKKDEILQLLKHIYQGLKPGGRLLAVTPNGFSPFSGATRYWDFSHETGFTPPSWRQLARVSGFKDILFEEYGPIPHSIFGIFRAALWKLVRLGIETISYIEVGGPRDISRVYTADMKIILLKSHLSHQVMAH